MDNIDNKIIISGDKSQARFAKGANLVADIVKKTLGPKGKNVIIQRSHNRPPLVTNDGVTVAENVHSQDELEELAIDTIRHIARQTNDRVGDGTTTSVVLAQSLIKKYLSDNEDSHVIGGKSTAFGVDTYKEIKEEKQKVVEMLRKVKKDIKSEEELAQVTAVSAESDELGKLVAGLRWKVGVDGSILMEDSETNEITTGTVSGMEFRGKLKSMSFITNPAKLECVAEEVPVLITNHRLSDPAVLDPIATQVFQQKRSKFVLMAEHFSEEVIKSINLTAKTTGIKIIPVLIKSLRTPEKEDVAVFCDAKFINAEENMELKDAKYEDLGLVKQIRTNDEKTVLIGGRGKVKDRVEVLKGQKKAEKDIGEKNRLGRRIGALSEGISTIYIGADSDTEKVYLKHKIEDAINASKAALDGGVVPGGGQALKKIAEELGKDSVLYETLNAPYNQIQENAGGELKIPKNIVDPVEVTIGALESAVSVIGTALTLDSMIANKKDKIEKSIDNLAETLKSGIKIDK